MKLLSAILLLFIVLMVLAPKWYIKNQKYSVDAPTEQRIKQLGDSALKTLDVPVVALIIYDGKIIGQGYNTSSKTGNIGEHAEINAISDIIRKTSFGSFNKLDRKKLLLLTTFEPCKMCEGAIIENDIKHTVVIRNKNLKHWLKKQLGYFSYQWYKQQATTDTLQEYLFEKHPYYDKEKAKQDL